MPHDAVLHGFLHREVEGAPIPIRRCDTGEIKDNVLESDCMDCTVEEVIEKMWPSFVYTGDNAAANQWIQENILKRSLLEPGAPRP